MIHNERMDEILDLERRKLAVQFAALEVAVDDRIKATEQRLVTAVTNAITETMVDFKADIFRIEDGMAELNNGMVGLKADVADLKTDVARVEGKIDRHLADHAKS